VEAERRQITVLFTDMVGFTSFSERAGEEAAFTLMQSLAKLMEDAVREHGGVVQGFTGDGIMAVFGAPVALEDAPLRACRASLAILDRLKAAGGDLEARHGLRPQLRIGINTGLAVVGQMQGGVTVLGDTVNVAARLQATAAPGAVVMSEAMLRLVQGLVDATSAGVHQFKGKAEPQQVFRLDAIRQGATRFGAAVGRGLTAYVGRERELEVLERALAEARHQLKVVDIVAEPGMGKSRLLHEFRQRVSVTAFILSGSCSPDGRQTPFLPFIEVVRGSFQVSAGEDEKEIARKLEMGLDALGLRSVENLALLLNLLGLKPPEGALAGLDGVLIGLRTRDLLQHLLAARCRLAPTVLLIEDLHWIDSVSEEVLSKITGGETKLSVLVLHTRRPEYEPAWLGRPEVAALRLEPLPAGDIRRLVQTRLGVDLVPDALIRLVTEKAEGNALFAEETVSFLTERGVVRAAGGKAEFDAGAVAAALPASLQSLLTARVDRLAPQDRTLLQAAAVIGRRFDPELLAAVANDGGSIDARLVAMQALDLIHVEAKSGDYAFKHALVRDALYQSLLTGPRVALHSKIAEEIERRSGNRLGEMAEVLAYHYSQTDLADKAFTYLAMAGAKSLGVYSLEEAGNYFGAAIALLDKYSDSASDQQVAELLVGYASFANLAMRFNSATETVERFKARLGRLGDNPSRVLIEHHCINAMIYSARFRDAENARSAMSTMASRLGDVKSTAYALASSIHLSSFNGLYSAETFDALSREALASASSLNDAYLQCLLRHAIAFEELTRGRMAEAREAAEELLAVGRNMNDPRSLGYGMFLRAGHAIVNTDYADALSLADAGLRIARTPFDQTFIKCQKVNALILLRRPEGIPLLRDFADECAANGWYATLAQIDGIWGIALILQGKISAGIRWIEQSILKREQEGFRFYADWLRIGLCEVYLEVLSGTEKAPAAVIARNILTLASIMFTAQRRVPMLIMQVRQNPRFDQNGINIGRCEMILGLLYKAKKKRALAVQHLTEANRIISQFGPSPTLTKVEAALAEVA
jgi:class 3 adenylate cyclase